MSYFNLALELIIHFSGVCLLFGAGLYCLCKAVEKSNELILNIKTIQHLLGLYKTAVAFRDSCDTTKRYFSIERKNKDEKEFWQKIDSLGDFFRWKHHQRDFMSSKVAEL